MLTVVPCVVHPALPQVLEEDIQDDTSNVTRFLALSREPLPPREGVLYKAGGRSGRWLKGQGSRVKGPGSRVQGPGSRDQGPGTRVQAPGSRLQALGSRVQAPGSRV